MVNVLNKLIAKVKAGQTAVMEFTPQELENGTLDNVEFTLNNEADPVEFDEVADKLGLPIREMFDDGEDVNLELFHCEEYRPAMLVSGNNHNLYKSFFHSGLCEIGGNAYRINVDEDNAFYLVKVIAKGVESYELYLSTETGIVLDEDDVYTVHRSTQALCNDNTEELKSALETLYSAVHDELHQPKIDNYVKTKLEAILV